MSVVNITEICNSVKIDNVNHKYIEKIDNPNFGKGGDARPVLFLSSWVRKLESVDREKSLKTDLSIIKDNNLKKILNQSLSKIQSIDNTNADISMINDALALIHPTIKILQFILNVTNEEIDFTGKSSSRIFFHLLVSENINTCTWYIQSLIKESKKLSEDLAYLNERMNQLKIQQQQQQQYSSNYVYEIDLIKHEQIINPLCRI